MGEGVEGHLVCRFGEVALMAQLSQRIKHF